jgi:hemoglobin-like flavoprotein
MNRASMHLIKTSFEWFVPCGPAMIAQVMRRLCDEHPGVRALFPDETSHFNKRIFATLAQVARNVDQFGSLTFALAQLGGICSKEGANSGHYIIFKDTLLSVMADLAGDDWTPKVHAAWSETLDAVMAAMIVGAVHEELRRAA